MNSIDVVTDLQFGSTGKGLLVDWLAESNDYIAACSTWGPNSGHTAIINGRPVIRTMVPLSLSNPAGPEVAFIGPGSVVNKENLFAEILDSARVRGGPVSVYVHENAAIIAGDDAERESAYLNKIGSTQKGTGEALLRKIRRDPDDQGSTFGRCWGVGSNFNLEGNALRVISAVEWRGLTRMLLNRGCFLVEGAQGFSLGINSGLYPYTTSRECTVAQILSDACLPVHLLGSVYGSARTFPIRVANRFDKDGKQVGWSGPSCPGQYELTWGDVGVKPEKTTVTGLQRRVFSFSGRQVADAIYQNGVHSLFLNFCNYFDPDPRYAAARALLCANKLLESFARETSTLVSIVFGFGPARSHLVQVPVSRLHSENAAEEVRQALIAAHERALAEGYNSFEGVGE